MLILSHGMSTALPFQAVADARSLCCRVSGLLLLKELIEQARARMTAKRVEVSRHDQLAIRASSSTRDQAIVETLRLAEQMDGLYFGHTHEPQGALNGRKLRT